MNTIDTIGIVASVTSVAGFLPQIYRNHQTRSVEDLSGVMLLNFALCSLAWVIYGHLTASQYVLITNIVGFCASCFLLGQKVCFKR